MPDLGNTFGALLIGCVLSVALWGIGTMQLYWYYTAYPNDRINLKIIVTAAWSFDSVQQALIIHSLYFYLIKNYFNPPGLEDYIWSYNVQSIFEALTSLLVQSFYVYRMFCLSHRNYYLAGTAMSLVLGKFGCNLAYLILGASIHIMGPALERVHPLSVSINCLAAAADIMIAVSMCTLLFLSRTGFSGSNTMVTKLMIYSMNTGLVTSFCAVASLIAEQAFPESYAYGAIYFLVSRLYVNSILATLNARRSLHEESGAGLEIYMDQFSVERTDPSDGASFRPFAGKRPASIDPLSSAKSERPFQWAPMTPV